MLLWLGGALVVAGWGRPRHRVAAVLRDWLPFALVLIAYDLSRGAADDLGLGVAWTPQIEADRLLFLGEVPTVWLQRRLLERDVQWWELGVSAVYMSHFIVPLVVPAALWLRDRARWLAYTRRFVTLSFLGVLTFIVFPAAPPWLAGDRGYLPPVERTVGRGWSAIGLDSASRLLEKGQASVNIVAAVPSLHAGYSALVVAALWRRARPAVRAVLVAYLLAMAFALVVSGEHYVVDVFLGWAYAWAACWAWARIERRRVSRTIDAEEPQVMAGRTSVVPT